jgi:hypothetical protein
VVATRRELGAQVGPLPGWTEERDHLGPFAEDRRSRREVSHLDDADPALLVRVEAPLQHLADGDRPDDGAAGVDL